MAARPFAGFTARHPGGRPQRGFTARHPGGRPQRGFTTRHPGGRPHRGFTARRPGGSPAGGAFPAAIPPARPATRPRRLWLLALAAAIAIAVALPMRLQPARLGSAPGSPDTLLPAGPRARPDQTSTAAPFARYGTVVLTVPGPLRLIAYHEAASPGALPLEPIGRVVADGHAREPAARGGDGGAYALLSSRGRRSPATSAVDLAMHDGVAVRSVVSGRVSLVETYRLYGRYPDTRIEIVPATRPDLQVAMLHLRAVRVVPGQLVMAGRTVVAGSANRFPFRSQIDRYVGGTPGPHVHVEIRSRPSVGRRT